VEAYRRRTELDGGDVEKERGMKKRSRRFGSASQTHWLLLVVGVVGDERGAGTGMATANGEATSVMCIGGGAREGHPGASDELSGSRSAGVAEVALDAGDERESTTSTAVYRAWEIECVR
jgi:hypothetical protein